MTTTDKPRRAHSFEKRIQEAAGEQFTSALIYGPSGAGKTTLLATAAFDERTAPSILLNMDGGITAARGVDPNLLTLIVIRDWQDYSEAYDYLLKADHPYKSAAVDSLSETHVYSLLSVVDTEIKKNDRRSDPNTLEQSDYGKAMVQLRRFMREFRKLRMHTFFTALPATMSVPREGLVTVPSMFGQLKEETVGMFDVAVYVNVEKVKKEGKEVIRHVAHLQNLPNVRAKVRTPVGMRLRKDRVSLPLTNGMTRLLDAIGDYEPAQVQ